MAINTNYYNYANYASLYANNYSANTYKNYSSSSLYDLLPSNTSSTQYGKNVAKRVSETVQQFISNAKVEAFNLKSSLERLLGSSKQGLSSFKNKAAESSNKDTLIVKAVDSSNSKNNNAVNVQINKVAASQENRGASLSAKNSAVDTGFSLGFNAIKLSVGNKSYIADFSVSATDTNRDVQKKMADSINSKNAGVKASVVYNAKDDTSSLVLESVATGTDKDGDLKFSLNDIAGNAVEHTGTANVSRYAQNAEYSINGGAVKTSRSNDIDIGNGISVTLKAEGAATVTAVKDTNTAISDIKDMINKFNDLLSTAETNKNDSRTNTLYRQLSDTAKYYASSLSKVGIEVTASGYLKVNESKLQSAAESGNLETFFTGDTGRNYGFANRVASIADKVDKNPTNYTTITYENTAYELNLNQYQLARYASYENTGLLLNMLV